jgi:hypothetical protein
MRKVKVKPANFIVFKDKEEMKKITDLVDVS